MNFNIFKLQLRKIHVQNLIEVKGCKFCRKVQMRKPIRKLQKILLQMKNYDSCLRFGVVCGFFKESLREKSSSIPVVGLWTEHYPAVPRSPHCISFALESNHSVTQFATFQIKMVPLRCPSSFLRSHLVFFHKHSAGAVQW